MEYAPGDLKPRERYKVLTSFVLPRPIEAMRVHMERYHPIGRMFADRYCRTDDRVVFPAAPELTAK